MLALVPRRTRIPVLICWVVALLAVLAAVGLGAVTLDLAALSTPPGLGFLLVRRPGALWSPRWSWARSASSTAARCAARAVAALFAAVAVAAPLGGLAWFVLDGGDELTDDRDAGIPAYMVQSSELGPEHGILVVRGSVEDGLTYTVRRDDGVTTGEDEVLDLTGEDRDFTALVQGLASRPTPEAVDALAARGIEYVVLPAPADGEVAARARRHRRPGAGQRRGPQHPRLAGRPAAVGERPRRAAVVAPDRAAGPPGGRDPGRAGAVRAVDRPRPGRRSAMRRRLGPDVVLAVVLPVVAVLALLVLTP